MILKELMRQKFDHKIVAMAGDLIQLIHTDEDGQIAVLVTVDVDRLRTFDEGVMYEMEKGPGGRTGIGGFFLDVEED